MHAPIAQETRIKADNIKYTRVLLNSSSGMVRRQIHCIRFVEIPLIPFPNIITPIYLKGSIPPRPKTVVWIVPEKTPKIRSKIIHTIKLVVSEKAFEANGRIIIRSAFIINPPNNLNINGTLLPYRIINIEITVNSPLTANGKIKAGP